MVVDVCLEDGGLENMVHGEILRCLIARDSLALGVLGFDDLLLRVDRLVVQGSIR